MDYLWFNRIKTLTVSELQFSLYMLLQCGTFDVAVALSSRDLQVAAVQSVKLRLHWLLP